MSKKDIWFLFLLKGIFSFIWVFIYIGGIVLAPTFWWKIASFVFVVPSLYFFVKKVFELIGVI